VVGSEWGLGSDFVEKAMGWKEMSRRGKEVCWVNARGRRKSPLMLVACGGKGLLRPATVLTRNMTLKSQPTDIEGSRLNQLHVCVLPGRTNTFM
jgi:hypothetical protein